jgi:hypothetical protein
VSNDRAKTTETAGKPSIFKDSKKFLELVGLQPTPARLDHLGTPERPDEALNGVEGFDHDMLG